MDRCAIAYEYHKAGYNCAQSVAGAFEDLTGLTKEQLMALAGGFGGGVGGSHEELCGAVSGGVLLSAFKNASVSSRPRMASSRFTSHLGWLYRMERYFTSSRSGMGGRLFLF